MRYSIHTSNAGWLDDPELFQKLGVEVQLDLSVGDSHWCLYDGNTALTGSRPIEEHTVSQIRQTIAAYESGEDITEKSEEKRG